ncbi:MAG: LamB/YcsF family protein, partial [Chloroflexia bacterium]|nr:LamB/YcsF family protein [Chloroflexia bacterium]
MTAFAVDLNSDLGESFGAFAVGHDDALFPLISSANVACGFHGGDPRVIEQTVARAAAHGVAVGAHPSFPDLVGFGRRALAATADEVRTDCLYQIGALAAFCRAAGVPLRHVKAHGALYNLAVKDATIAAAIAAAVRAFDPAPRFFAAPGSALEAAGHEAGLTVVREAFADRAYHIDGSLVARGQPGAV